MKNKDITLKKRMNRLLLQCVVAEIGFGIGLMLLLTVIRLICDRVIWEWSNIIYRFFKLFEAELPWLVGISLMIGWVFITWYFLSKILGYLNEVADAAESLASPDQTPITLSPDLPDLQNRLNQVREKALSNIRTAQEAEQRKNDLIIYLAHDLKTPLTSVIGYLTLLQDVGPIPKELQEKYLSISLQKAERLEDLINEFFEIARFNLSSVTLDYRRVNMTRLLQQLTYEFKPMLLDKNLTCTLDMEPDIMVRCDPNKIQRVFDNLLRNAVNYSYDGSEIQISGRQDGNTLRVQFRNQGNTIPREKLNRIFEQFFRLDSSRSSESGGAGLGLAISKEIVEHHHGEIFARSEDNQIEFEVHLPVL